MRFIDISRKVYPGMAAWPGDRPVNITRDLEIDKGDECNLSSIEMSLHAGTHVDAPFHFVKDGDKVSELDMSYFIGKAKVFELKVDKCISLESIKHLPINSGDIVLFKTLNSYQPESETFDENFIYLDISAAEFLVEKKVKTVGVDYLSVEGYSMLDAKVHKLLLSQKVGIIEGLYMSEAVEGEYHLVCLPLKVQGADGAPARAVLFEL